MAALAICLLAVAASLAGTGCLYLGAPRQLVLTRPLPARASRGWGLTLLLSAWLLWCGIWHPATALFAVLTVAMAVAVALPVLAVAGRRERL
jgi:hypothetical protein